MFLEKKRNCWKTKQKFPENCWKMIAGDAYEPCFKNNIINEYLCKAWIHLDCKFSYYYWIQSFHSKLRLLILLYNISWIITIYTWQLDASLSETFAAFFSFHSITAMPLSNRCSTGLVDFCSNWPLRLILRRMDAHTDSRWWRHVTYLWRHINLRR